VARLSSPRGKPRAVAPGELPVNSDVKLLAGLPLWLLQNWRLEHHRQPDEAVVDRIVRQFYTPLSPGLMRVCGRASRCWPGRRSCDPKSGD
jgi:hypothetical protein